MHRSTKVKFINAKQAKEVHAYKNIKRKLYKTNAAIWFNKTCSDNTKLHLVGHFYKICIMMHGSTKVKFINAKQAKEVHTYKNIKRKLYKTNAAIWFNKTCSDNTQLHLVDHFCKICIMMHGSTKVKFTNAKQAKEVHAYKNIKQKLYKTNAAIWFNKTCSCILLVISVRFVL